MGEAAEKIDAMYWDIEYVIGVVMVELRQCRIDGFYPYSGGCPSVGLCLAIGNWGIMFDTVVSGMAIVGLMAVLVLVWVVWPAVASGGLGRRVVRGVMCGTDSAVGFHLYSALSGVGGACRSVWHEKQKGEHMTPELIKKLTSKSRLERLTNAARSGRNDG